MNGVSFRLAFFAPRTRSPRPVGTVRANRLAVARQVHYSATDTCLSLDMVLFINGLPTATVELKNPLTGRPSSRRCASTGMTANHRRCCSGIGRSCISRSTPTRSA